MAKQTFTAGQVLTASEMNSLQANDFNLSVTTQTDNYTLVTADKGTREVANKATAITFTVPSATFAAGDTVEIHNIGAGTLTLSGSGVTINSADVLTVAQWQGGTLYFTSASAAIWFPRAKTVSAGGLVYLTGTSFSAVSSVSFPNNTFTSTYRNYRVILTITDNSTDDTTLAMRLRASGTDDATGYYGALFGVNYAADTFRVSRANNATSFPLGNMRTTVGFDQAYTFDVINPQQATTTQWMGNGTPYFASDNGGATFGGVENSATQFDAMSFIPGAGTITGTYRVYGYADS